MNSTTASLSPPDHEHSVTEFALIFGLAIGAISLTAIIIITSYICTHKPPPRGPSSRSDDEDSVTIDVFGLDETTLNNYPKLMYSQVKLDGLVDSCTSCSICLAEFLDSDLLRLLPNCKHFFHVLCIDPWLKLHPSCPMCRNAPARPHLPAAQMAPRASRRVFFDPWFLQLRR